MNIVMLVFASSVILIQFYCHEKSCSNKDGLPEIVGTYYQVGKWEINK